MIITWADIVAGAILLAIGGGATFVFSAIKNRLAILKWQASHNLIAQAAPDSVFGDLKITFNKVECANIYRTTIRITNGSGKDLKDFEISIRFKEGDAVVYENVWVEGSAWALAWADNFKARVEATQPVRDNPDSATPAERQIAFGLNRHRDYHVRALNRSGMVSADFLVHTEQGQPFVEVMSESAGIKVVPKPYAPPLKSEYWGIPAVHGARLGLILNIALIAILYQYVTDRWVIVTIAVLTTALCLFIGVFAIRLFRGLLGLFR
jgi:hypothetical protein